MLTVANGNDEGKSDFTAWVTCNAWLHQKNLLWRQTPGQSLMIKKDKIQARRGGWIETTYKPEDGLDKNAGELR